MRRLFIVIGVVIALLVALVAGFIVFFDPNAWREEIATAVEEETGRSFVIEGEISWSLFPRLGIELGAWQIGSGNGFGDTPFASAEGLRAGMQVMPLLRGELVLETLELRGPTVNLIRNAKGRANWEGFGGGTGAGSASTGGAGTGTLPDWLAGLSLGGIELSDGVIRFDDRTTGEQLAVDPLNVSLGAFQPGQPASFDITALLTGDGEPLDTRLAGELIVRTDGSASLRNTNLEANDLRITQISADAAPSADGWRLHPLSARFYEGDYAGDLQIGTGRPAMPLQFDESLSGVAMGPLIASFADFERLTGEAAISANGGLSLAAGAAPLATLNADTEFAISDGAIRGINVARTIRNALARLEGRPLEDSAETPQTDFTSLTGTVAVRDGVARSDDIALDSPLLRLRGTGSSDLVDQVLDLTLTVNLVGSLEGQGGAALESLQGVPIPLRITGSWDSPEVAVDIEQVLRDSQEQQLRERVEEEVDELRDRLRGLFE